MNGKTFSAQPVLRERWHSFNRRSFLRGVGACLALPAFESLNARKACAANVQAPELARTATGAPLRTAFVFFPNGAVPASWWPEENHGELMLRETLRPLQDHRQYIQVLSGLDHLCANAGLDGGGDHARATGVFLTGVRLNKSPTEIRAGVSIDQAIARRIGHLTRFSSLELTCDDGRTTGACDSDYACVYQYNLSWTSATTPAPAEANPRLVFERLFGAGAPGERARNMERRLLEQRSVLDFVLEDARHMQKRLSAGDRDKLDQYLTGVRAIESRIQKAEQFGPPREPDIQTPRGIPAKRGEYVQLMYDLMVMAFQTDSTRIATLCLGHDGDNRPLQEIGVLQGHHDLSHHSNRVEKLEALAQIELWYAQQFARFLQKLREAKDLDGNSILHNSMIVYGGGNADANLHTHTNLPIVVAGRGGGTLNGARYVRHGSKPMANLFLSLAERMGVSDLGRFGDSTAVLSDV
jgi:hypothetical protein